MILRTRLRSAFGGTNSGGGVSDEAGFDRREAGFTLVELLVSVALLALLTVVLVSGLRVGTRFTRDPERLERASRIAVTQEALRARLADARPLLAPGRDDPRVLFEGSSDEVAFIALAPRSVMVGGLEAFAIQYLRHNPGTDGALVLRSGAFNAAPGAGERVRTTTLLDHVRRAEFSYFGPALPDEAPRWHDSWRDALQLPILVRLFVEFSDGSRMPDLIVALRLSPRQEATGAPAVTR